MSDQAVVDSLNLAATAAPTAARARKTRSLVLAVFALLGSRALGIVRELLISIAYGFSASTDLFYQATFPLTAVQTVLNGPFTTAFAARFNHTDPVSRRGHAAYYRRKMMWIGAGLCALYGLAALVLYVAGKAFLPNSGAAALAALAMSPAPLGVALVGFYVALSSATGRVGAGANLLLLLNASFVVAFVIVWALHLSLQPWTLPACYSVATVVGLWGCRLLDRHLDADLLRASEALPPEPLPRLMKVLIFAGTETSLFLLTQGLVLVLATSTGHGWASGAALAQRVCFSVNGLIISPYASVLMLRVLEDGHPRRLLLRSLLLTLAGLVIVSFGLVYIGLPILNYFFSTGKRAATVAVLTAVLPGFAMWMIPLGLNVIVCRVMFGLGLERPYTTWTVGAYITANLVRLALAHWFGLELALEGGALVEFGCVVVLVLKTLHHLKGSPASPTGN